MSGRFEGSCATALNRLTYPEISTLRAPADRLQILIFGINYAPELAGIAPYTTGLAEHLARQGHRVVVVTGVPHYPEWRPRRVQAGGQAVNPTVSRHRHYVPSRASSAGRVLYELTWLISALPALSREHADVVVGVIPSLSGGVLAWLAARHLAVPFGLIFQDTMGAAAKQSGYSGAARLAKAARAIERVVTLPAAGVAVVAEGFRGYLESLGVEPARIQRVRNWSRWTAPTESRDECRDRLGWSSEDFVCLHAGNMGKKQGLENVVKAAALIDGSGIRVVLAGDGNDRARLESLARSNGVRNLSFVGMQPPGEYEAMLRAADVLLVNQRGSVEEMSLPSKIGSYFAAGRPVVAAVSDRSETAREIRLARGGLIVKADDPGSLAQTLDRLRFDMDERGRLAATAEAFAKANLGPEQSLAEYERWLDELVGTSGASIRSPRFGRKSPASGEAVNTFD